MAKHRKHSNHLKPDSEQMLRYLADKLSVGERHRLEREMLEDDFSAEAMEGLSSQDADTIKADLASLKKRLKSRGQEQKSPFTIWRIAAALTLLLAFSFAIYYVINSRKDNQLAQEKPLAPALEKKDTTALDKTPLAAKAKKIQPKADTLLNTRQPEDHQLAMEKRPESQQAEKQKAPVVRELDTQTSTLEETTGQAQVQSPAQSLSPEIAEKPRTSSAIGNAVVADDALANSTEIPAVKSEPFKADKKTAAAEPKAAMARRSDYGDEAVKTIKGKVISSEDHQPIPGANVILKGTSSGVISDIQGGFSLDVPRETSAVLVISSIGYDTEEIPVKDQQNIQVTLHPDVSALSEVVVVGYGESTGENNPDNHIVPPKPRAGMRAFNDYIDKNLRYPPSEIPQGIKGMVKLKFSVETDGSVTDIQVVKSLGEAFDQEAVRLVKERACLGASKPKWQPPGQGSHTKNQVQASGEAITISLLQKITAKAQRRGIEFAPL